MRSFAMAILNAVCANRIDRAIVAFAGKLRALVTPRLEQPRYGTQWLGTKRLYGVSTCRLSLVPVGVGSSLVAHCPDGRRHDDFRILTPRG